MRPTLPMKTGLCAVALAMALLWPASTAAQDDPFQGALYDGELVLTRQAAIGLTARQRDEIVVLLQQTQSAVVPTQLELAAAGERLLGLLRPRQIDVEAAVAEAGEVMRLENEVKSHHIRLLIDIKNLLTVEQQQRLDEIRRSG